MRNISGELQIPVQISKENAVNFTQKSNCWKSKQYTHKIRTIKK
jgi:hypothetical protein